MTQILFGIVRRWQKIMSRLEHLTDTKLTEYFKLCEVAGKRAEGVKIHQYDPKFLYHAVRLASEIEQVLEFGTIDLRRDNELYKSIRRGDWKLDDAKKWLVEKERVLSKLYETSTLRNTPAKAEIKQLLLDCLEMYFGSLEKCEFHNPDKYQTIVEQIREIVK